MGDYDASSSGAAATIPADGQYIIAEQYDASGNKTGEIKFTSADVGEVLSKSSEEGFENALATFQNDEGVFEIASSEYEGMIFTCCVVIVAGLFMCLGAIAVRTLLRSFEK